MTLSGLGSGHLFIATPDLDSGRAALHAGDVIGDLLTLGHANGTDVDLVTLAQALGYYDQAHFTTDFEKLVGKPPAAYRRSCKMPIA